MRVSIDAAATNASLVKLNFSLSEMIVSEYCMLLQKNEENSCNRGISGIRSAKISEGFEIFAKGQGSKMICIYLYIYIYICKF